MFSAAVEEWGELLMDMGNREVGDLKVLWQPMTLGKLSIISLNTTEIPERVVSETLGIPVFVKWVHRSSSPTPTDHDPQQNTAFPRVNIAARPPVAHYPAYAIPLANANP